MSKAILNILRGERAAEDLQNQSDFVDLVISKAAERRNLRPDQVRLSLMLNAMSDPAISGAEKPLTQECQGLH